MTDEDIVIWLLKGDVSIQYQVFRDLLSIERFDLKERITEEGWGSAYLSKRKTDGHWGKGFYQPKWTSSHYTLLDLRNLYPSPENKLIRRSIDKILNECKAADGGIFPISKKSDICVNGMFLNYASYFQADERKMNSIVDLLLSEIMQDGGFNCRSNRSGAKHSSLHSTLSVLEGIDSYKKGGYTYRLHELLKAKQTSEEFILQHKLFLSDRTGHVIDQRFLKYPYPCRWKYDVLRCLDYFQSTRAKWDPRMKPAIEELLGKRKSNGLWNINAKHPGKLHFEMEKAGQPSRWNTLRALRILLRFNKIKSLADPALTPSIPS